MSEQRENYRDIADTESATQQHSRASSTLAIVRPHLEIAAQALSQSTPDFVTRLTAFLTNPDDPTGLKLDNLREQARYLHTTLGAVSGLLTQLADSQGEPS
jgi:hypothetical protein